MTTEPDLLPLPEYFQHDLSHMTWEGLRQAAIDYARACVAHATAAKDAEVEALRAEVRYWQECGEKLDDKLIEAEARAERLTEALQEQRANAALVAACDPDTIRALLAERDALAAALEAARVGWRGGGGRIFCPNT